MRKISMTALPPAKTEDWYHPARACRLCRAKVMTRFERDGVVKLRVLHEDTCTSSPERAVEVERSRRVSSGRAGLTARKARTSVAPAPSHSEVI